MKALEFKTNIMCAACVAKVTSSLNEAVGESNWKVDIQNPKKILTVTAGTVGEEQVITALQKVGYKGELI